MKTLYAGITGALAMTLAALSSSANALSVNVSGAFDNPTTSEYWHYKHILNQDNASSGTMNVPVNTGALTDSVAYFGWGIDVNETIDECLNLSTPCQKLSSHFWFNGTGSVDGSTASEATLGEMFSLGEFTYTNEETILSGGYVTIDFLMNIEVGGVSLGDSTYSIGIDNTPNDSAPFEDTAELLSGPMNINFMVGDTEYLLHFDGFSRDGGATLETYTSLAEDSATTAEIYATITQQVTPVPVPAAAWLMLSGLLGLIGIARKRR
ncbi:MAG TPA: choice-of-anchor K domain-containing protein [Thiohalobacter sp.]|nr:choice-of-anchor K domain-containing protein [Thiohalobacter sp.]